MNYPAIPLSNENRSPLLSSPNRIYSSDDSPLKRSRTHRLSINSSIRAKSPSPTSPKRLSSTELKAKPFSPLAEDSPVEQEEALFEQFIQYASYLKGTVKKNLDSKKDVLGVLRKELNTLKIKHQASEASIQEKNQTIALLTNQHQEYQSNLMNLQKQLDSANVQLSHYQKLEQELESVQMKNEQLQSTVLKCNQELQLKEEDVSQWKSRALQSEADYQAKHSEYQSLTSQLSSLEEQHATEVQRLTQELERVNSDNISLQNKCTFIRGKANVLMQDFEALQEVKMKLDMQEQKSQQQLKEKEATIVSLCHEKSKFMLELNQSQETIAGLRSEVEAAATEITEREKKVLEVLSQNKLLSDEVSRLSLVCEKTELQSQDYLQWSENLKTQLNELEASNFKLEEELKSVQKETSSLNLQLSEFKEHKSQLQAQLDTSQTQNRELESRIRHLMDDNETIQTDSAAQLQSLEQKLNSLESQLLNSNSSHAQLQLQLFQLKEEKTLLNKEIQSLNEKCSLLSNEKETLLQSLEESKQQLESLSAKETSLVAKADSLQLELNSTKESLHSYHEKCNLQSKDLESLRNEKLDLTVQLQTTEDTLRDVKSQLQEVSTKYKERTVSSEELEFKLKCNASELVASQKQIHILQHQLSTVEETLQKVNLKFEIQAKELELIRKEKSQDEVKLLSTETRTNELKSQLQTALDSFNDAQTSLEEANSSLKLKSLEFDASQSEIRSLQQQLTSTQDLLQRTHSKYEQQTKELHSVRQEKVQVELELHSSEASLNDLKLQLQEMSVSFKETHASLDDVQLKLKKKTSELEMTQSELHSLQLKLRDTQEKLTTLESKQEESTSASEAHYQEIETFKHRLESELQEHEKERARLQTSLSTQLTIVKHVTSEKDKLENQLLILRTKRNQLEDTNDKLVEQSKQQQLVHQELERKYTSLQKEHHQLLSRSSHLESNYADQAKAFKDLEHTLSEAFVEEKEALEIRITNLVKEKEALIQEKKDTGSSSTDKIAALEKEKLAIQEKLSRNEVTLSELHSQLNHKSILLHRYHVQSTEAKQKYELQLERQTQQIKTLQTAVNHLTKKLEQSKEATHVVSSIQASDPSESIASPETVDVDVARKYDRLQARYRSLELEFQELKEVTLHVNEGELSKQCQDLEKELSALRIEHENLMKENQQLNAKLDLQHDLLSKNSDLSMQVAMLDEINTSLVGHQNQNQKIRYLVRIKEECLRLKEQLAATTKERDQNRHRITELEDELGVLRSVEQTNGKKRLRIDHFRLHSSPLIKRTEL